MTEPCAQEPGAIQRDGLWSWCKPDPTFGEMGHDIKKVVRKAITLGPGIAGVVAVGGLIWLLIAGSRARKRSC
jgi:hypothetical protein